MLRPLSNLCGFEPPVRDTLDDKVSFGSRFGRVSLKEIQKQNDVSCEIMSLRNALAAGQTLQDMSMQFSGSVRPSLDTQQQVIDGTSVLTSSTLEITE